PDSKYELDNLIELMVNNSGVTLEVAGHTDNTGDAGSNLDLSNKRALAVKDYMINRGVDGARLKATGYGQSKPIDSNDTPEGRQNNRRTEFKILTK
ncbi:MAG: OmpA family protein, partial [Saprospiraceae bacterium]|nr:OmpA family protein [Saprospiraceae bacterium]